MHKISLFFALVLNLSVCAFFVQRDMTPKHDDPYLQGSHQSNIDHQGYSEVGGDDSHLSASNIHEDTFLGSHLERVNKLHAEEAETRQLLSEEGFLSTDLKVERLRNAERDGGDNTENYEHTSRSKTQNERRRVERRSHRINEQLIQTTVNENYNEQLPVVIPSDDAENLDTSEAKEHSISREEIYAAFYNRLITATSVHDVIEYVYGSKNYTSIKDTSSQSQNVYADHGTSTFRSRSVYNDPYQETTSREDPTGIQTKRLAHFLPSNHRQDYFQIQSDQPSNHRIRHQRRQIVPRSHAGPEGQVEEESQLKQIDIRQWKDALDHLHEMDHKKECRIPQPECLHFKNLSRNANEVYYPQCTVVYRCQLSYGCCKDGSQCGPKNVEFVSRNVFVQKAFPNITEVRLFTFPNHTECECKPAKAIVACRRCPRPFVQVSINTTECECKCIDDNKKCQDVKRGRDELAQEDSDCVAAGECLPPSCHGNRSYSVERNTCLTDTHPSTSQAKTSRKRKRNKHDRQKSRKREINSRLGSGSGDDEIGEHV